jgi:xanthine dehydrogenase accessory factor
VDARTAVVLLFHEHSWEPPILAHALDSDAFYIGALGSLQTHQNRLKHLSALGVSDEASRTTTAPPSGLFLLSATRAAWPISVLSDIISIA